MSRNEEVIKREMRRAFQVEGLLNAVQELVHIGLTWKDFEFLGQQQDKKSVFLEGKA